MTRRTTAQPTTRPAAGPARRRLRGALGAGLGAALVATLASGLAAGDASAAGPTHDQLMAPYLNGPAHPRTTGIDVARDKVLVVAQGRNLDTFKRTPIEEATFADKATMLANRNVPLTGITVYNWTADTTSPIVSGNRYATWPQLQGVVARGGAVTSEGLDHNRLDSMTPEERWQDTCGVLPSYRARGLDASSMYAYSGGPYQAVHQKQLVKNCYAFGRQYSTKRNVMKALADPWVLGVRSLNGGCATAASTCFGVSGTRGYDTLDNLRATVTPKAGEVAVLQVYHLLVGRGPTWDCTSTPHQTSTTETYCLSDVMAFLDGLPSDVKVATTADLAAAVGRAPGQLPGLTLRQYLRSQS